MVEYIPNLLFYLTWRGYLTLRQAAWNLVDSLLMASLSYNHFQDVVSDAQGKSLRECAPLLGLENMTGGQYFQQWRALLFAMAESERFGRMRLHDYVNEVDEERIIQFSALTAEMEDGSTFRFEYVYTYAPEQTGKSSGETGRICAGRRSARSAPCGWPGTARAATWRPMPRRICPRRFSGAS